MADFCSQCSLELFGEDFKDLAGLGGDTPKPPGYGYAVLCEGCGYIFVNEEGYCVSPACIKHGDNKNESSKTVIPNTR